MNLMGSVGNNALNFFDILGLDKLTLTYDMQDKGNTSFRERFHMPNNTKWIKTMDGVFADIKKQVGKYSPDGKGKCNCVLRLNLTERSGVKGIINLGDGQINSRTRKTIQNAKMILGEHPGSPRILRYLKYTEREREFLKAVKKLMCKGGTVDFAQCDDGGSPATEEFLDDIFGDDIKTITHDNKNVVWWMGKVRETSPKKKKENETKN